MGESFRPSYRYQLRGWISMKGYRTASEFADAVECDVSKLSRILNGWEMPNERLQNQIMKVLEISNDDLKRLLNGENLISQ